MSDAQEKTSPLRLNMNVEQILDMMAVPREGADRVRTIGTALITYKAAELNARATEQLGEWTRQVGDMNVRATDRLTGATTALWIMALVQAALIAMNMYITWFS